jgi:hypothetical protein
MLTEFLNTVQELNLITLLNKAKYFEFGNLFGKQVLSIYIDTPEGTLKLNFKDNQLDSATFLTKNGKGMPAYPKGSDKVYVPVIRKTFSLRNGNWILPKTRAREPQQPTS